MDISRLKFPLVVTLTGLFLGLISDLLLYNQPLGISVPFIFTFVIVALLILAAVEGTGVVWANLWLIIPIMFLSAMSTVRAAPGLRFLNIVGALLLFSLLVNRLATRPLTELSIGGYLEALLESSIFYSALAFPILLLQRNIRDTRERGGEGSRLARRLVIGILIAVPFLCLFTCLFASADLIFGTYVQNILENLSIANLIGHTVLTLILAWIIMGKLAYGLSRTPDWRGIFHAVDASGDSPDEESEDADKSTPKTPTPASTQFKEVRNLLGILEASVVLFSVDALFLVFVVIQFAALFGGEAFLRSQGLTYAEYARRGFFELLAVSLITLGLILVIEFFTRREDRRHRLVFLLGSGLMIAMTVIILASAFLRLRLYELAYGFTRLRIYPHVFMVWLAVLIVYLLILLIVERPRLFAAGVLIVAVGFVATLDLLNPDAFIVRQNLARYEAGEELDVDHLGSLSEDAIPHLIPLLYEYGPEIGAQTGPWLHLHLDSLDRRQERAGWPSYHFGINQAYLALDLNRELIEQFEPAYRSSFGYD